MIAAYTVCLELLRLTVKGLLYESMTLHKNGELHTFALDIVCCYAHLHVFVGNMYYQSDVYLTRYITRLISARLLI